MAFASTVRADDRSQSLKGADASSTWSEIKLVKSARLSPFERVEIRRQLGGESRDGTYNVAVRWKGNWFGSDPINADQVPSATCKLGVGRVDSTAIKAIRLADGSPAVLVDFGIEQTELSQCLSGSPSPEQERRAVDARVNEFYSGRGGSPNGHVFVVCGVASDRVRCTSPVNTRADRFRNSCDAGSTLAFEHGAVVETCATNEDAAVTSSKTSYAITL
jgi:hypothetical protein